mgnify:CR=1 FL=1
MKKIILALTILIGLFILIPHEAKAYSHVPWYACYVEQGSQFEKCVGPFQNQFSCGAYRYQIPYGARWTGCKK